MQMYEAIFNVTYTCQNGNERTVRKSVYSKPFDKDGKFVVAGKRIEASRKVLEDMHYYNVSFVKLCNTSLPIAEI